MWIVGVNGYFDSSKLVACTWVAATGGYKIQYRLEGGFTESSQTTYPAIADVYAAIRDQIKTIADT